MFSCYYHYEEESSGITKDTLESYKAIGINCNKYSFAEGPLDFTMILGVTGTLNTLSQEQ